MPDDLGVGFDIGTATDIGRVREHNEDALLALSPQDGAGGGVLVAVADGMGGHNAGEVASALAVQTLEEAFRAEPPEAEPATLLRRAVESANRAIWDSADADESRSGMGTTLVCA